MINSAARQILSKKLFERTLKKSQTNKKNPYPSTGKKEN